LAEKINIEKLLYPYRNASNWHHFSTTESISEY
jgi:hypothetical protein